MKLNLNKTAVEWLTSELTDVERNLVNKTFLQLNKTIAGNRLKDIFTKAKEMEKEQIEKAYQNGYNNAYFDTPKDKETYYKETYE